VRRLARWFFSGLTVLSMLLAAVALWVRSHFVADHFIVNKTTHATGLNCAQGSGRVFRAERYQGDFKEANGIQSLRDRTRQRNGRMTMFREGG
jgi:hypothetical protein